MLKQRGGGEGRRAPRFKIGKRIGSRRKLSSEKKSLPPLKTVIKAIKVDHAENSSSIMMDVLAERESILSSDSTVCESIIDDKEEEELQMVRVDAIVQQDEDFSVSLQTWLHDVDALVHSNEMSALFGSSVAVSSLAIKTAVHIATLPMTVPLHVVTSTTGFVVDTCTFCISEACSSIDRVLNHHHQGQNPSSSPTVEGLIRNATGIIPLVLNAVGKIKDDMCANLLGLVAPVLQQGEAASEQKLCESPAEKRSRRCVAAAAAGESSAEQDTQLARLRLDYPSSPSRKTNRVVDSPPEVSKEVVVPLAKELVVREEAPSSNKSTDVSKFLLRVCDLDILLPSDEANRDEKVHHIDLSNADTQLTKQALDALIENGLALLSSCPDARLNYQRSQDLVDWKPEGSTAKLLKKKTKINSEDWVTLMSKEVLIWSGKLKNQDARKADVPVFLSRGIVPVSPKGMLNLFWDDSRTRSYNKFSLGRSTSMEIENSFHASSANNSVRATKVVKSETQVPFTGFSVVMSTLMHARQLQEPQQCYVIVSRSLSPGRAGSHVGSSESAAIDEGKNELLWGVNVLRSVPGHPSVTDLTSISQVSSSLVVQFLTHRVGIMAVESCYSAMRGN